MCTALGRMALAASVQRSQDLQRALWQLRKFSSGLALLQRAAAAQDVAAGPGGELKRMNLCSAINDALHIAMANEKKCASTDSESCVPVLDV